jgi:hypothetical protein
MKTTKNSTDIKEQGTVKMSVKSMAPGRPTRPRHFESASRSRSSPPTAPWVPSASHAQHRSSGRHSKPLASTWCSPV